MRKVLNCSFLLLVVLIGFMCNNPEICQEKSAASEEYVLFFSGEIDESSLLKIVDKYNMEKITELRYKIGDITSGYTPTSDRIDLEIKKGLESHVKNINSISSSLCDEESNEALSKKSTILLHLNKSADLAKNEKFFFAGVNIIALNDVIERLVDDGVVEGCFIKGVEYADNTKSLDKKLLKEPWAPFEGTSEVTQYYALNKFRFNNVSAFSAINSYEHETQFYDGSFLYSFANYNGSWSSNMPYAYLDSRFLDDPRIENYAVGSNKPISFVNNQWYYAFVALKPGFLPYCDVRIKGQLGEKRSDDCYSNAWCTLKSLQTTGSLLYKNAPWSNVQAWTY